MIIAGRHTSHESQGKAEESSQGIYGPRIGLYQAERSGAPCAVKDAVRLRAGGEGYSQLLTARSSRMGFELEPDTLGPKYQPCGPTRMHLARPAAPAATHSLQTSSAAQISQLVAQPGPCAGVSFGT
ncbi:hypothetical protein MHYP_G00229890 [Metynnis hypsauchen]